MANIIIGVRFLTNKLQRIKFENVELDEKASGLKEKTSQQIGTPMDQIDLMYAGLILEDDQPLKSYGITPGVMVHVLKKRIKKEVAPKTYTEAEIMELAASIRTTFKKGFAFFFTKLTNAEEIRTEVFAHLPPTCADPVARAIALDPHLHSLLCNVTVLRQVIARHPDIVEVVRAMGTYMHKRQAELKAAHAHSGSSRHWGHSSGNRSTTSSTQTAAGSARYGMFEDDDVDIEDVDADVDGDNDEDLPSPISGSSSSGSFPLARNASYNAITAAQLANAIANATHLTSRSGLAGTPTTPRPILGSGNGSTSTAPVITSEMFSGALQHAFSNLPSGAGATPVLSTPPPLGNQTSNLSHMSVDELRIRFQQQLMQMREMGLSDEEANIRALQATMGNVQAAIDLVFNADIE